MTILFHNQLIHAFSLDLFKTLLYRQHLTTPTPKLFEFNDATESINGYLLVKDNIKYLLPHRSSSGEDQIDDLPIRVLETEEVVLGNKDVVQHIQKFRSFTIKPVKTYTMRQMIGMDGITHQDPKLWTFLKLIAFIAYARRINVTISGIRESGKTSAFESYGQLTNKGYVIKQPRSILGLAPGLSVDGFMALDEMGGMDSESKRLVANFLYQQGEFSLQFKTGKGKALAYDFAAIHDIHDLSCIVLCNLIEDYDNPQNFFHNMFDNSQAINSRFYPIRLNKPWLDKDEKERERMNTFLDSKQFKDIPQYDDTVRDMFVSIVKSMEWYKENWDSLVDWDKVEAAIPNRVRGRHLLSYRQLLAGFWIYASEDADADKTFQDLKFQLDSYNHYYYRALQDRPTAAGLQQTIVEDVV
jgi:hypothetical protein